MIFLAYISGQSMTMSCMNIHMVGSNDIVQVSVVGQTKIAQLEQNLLIQDSTTTIARSLYLTT